MPRRRLTRRTTTGQPSHGVAHPPPRLDAREPAADPEEQIFKFRRPTQFHEQGGDNAQGDSRQGESGQVCPYVNKGAPTA